MSIQEHLNKIRNAIYGREVRESIAKGIETAYDDASENGNANMEVRLARGSNPNLNTRLNKMEDTDRQTTAQLANTERELSARVSAIIANAGDGSLPTEVVDMRTVNGITYPVAGDALRSLESLMVPQLIDNYYPEHDSSLNVVATQSYSNNEILNSGVVRGIKMLVRSTSLVPTYVDLLVIIPNDKVVSTTKIDFTPTVVGLEEITISDLNILIPQGAVIATRSPSGASSYMNYYATPAVGNLMTYNANNGREASSIAGKIAHQIDFREKKALYDVVADIHDKIDAKEETKSPLEGELWTVVGDSISDNKNYGRLKMYYEWIAEETGCEISMEGKAATGFLTRSTSQNSENIMERISLLDPNSDYITVFAGTNDVSQTLGTLGTTDIETVYGAIDYTCRALIEKFPTKKIGFFTPIPRAGYTGASNKLQQIAKAIKEVCATYSIAVLDLYVDSGLFPNNEVHKQTFFDNADGLHPNSLGHQRIAPRIKDFMEKL